jgi:hypothetical protein
MKCRNGECKGIYCVHQVLMTMYDNRTETAILDSVNILKLLLQALPASNLMFPDEKQCFEVIPDHFLQYLPFLGVEFPLCKKHIEITNSPIFACSDYYHVMGLVNSWPEKLEMDYLSPGTRYWLKEHLNYDIEYDQENARFVIILKKGK